MLTEEARNKEFRVVFFSYGARLKMFTRTKQNPALLRGLFIYFGLKIEVFDMLFVENRLENGSEGI